MVLDTQTGENDTNFNTDGNSNIKTGNANIVANVLNIANMNIIGGTWWLEIVNEGGNWIGKILGAPDGSNLASSSLIEFLIDPVTGGVTATNSGNGAGSDNQANANNTVNNNVNQTNTAVVNNELNLSANTGGNTSSFNTGGSSDITTGNANIVANIVNFVNNNITGGGKLVVTLVNVFGSWMGDFVAPGTSKNNNSNDSPGIGGPVAQTQEVNSSSSQSQSSNSSSENSGNDINITTVANNNPITNTVRILAAATGSFQGLKILSAANSDEVSPSVNTAGAKKITLNLAWIITFAPVILMLYLISKKYLFKYLPRKREI